MLGMKEVDVFYQGVATSAKRCQVFGFIASTFLPGDNVVYAESGSSAALRTPVSIPLHNLFSYNMPGLSRASSLVFLSPFGKKLGNVKPLALYRTALRFADFAWNNLVLFLADNAKTYNSRGSRNARAFLAAILSFIFLAEPNREIFATSRANLRGAASCIIAIARAELSIVGLGFVDNSLKIEFLPASLASSLYPMLSFSPFTKARPRTKSLLLVFRRYRERLVAVFTFLFHKNTSHLVSRLSCLGITNANRRQEKLYHMSGLRSSWLSLDSSIIASMFCLCKQAGGALFPLY